MTIILISGRASSGKTTLANYLVSHYGFESLAFANILKDQVSDRYNISRYYFDDTTLKETPLMNYPVNRSLPLIDITFDDLKNHYKYYNNKWYHTPRSLLILEGSYMARAIDPDIWINSIIRKIKTSNNKDFVIGDLRYSNEAEKIKQVYADVKILRINRYDKHTTNDISESGMDNYNFDHILDNKGSLDELYIKIDQLILK